MSKDYATLDGMKCDWSMFNVSGEKERGGSQLDGRIYDTVLEDVTMVRLIEIPSRLSVKIKEYSSGINVGVFFKSEKTPIFKFDTPITITDGTLVYINDISDIPNLIKQYGYIEAIDGRVINKDIYTSIHSHLHTNPFLDISHLMVMYLESRIMTIEHAEFEFVLSDPMGISDHIILTSLLAGMHDTFGEFICTRYEGIHGELLHTLDAIYSELEVYFLDTMDKTFINSIKLKCIHGRRIEVIEYAPPSSRRYKLNISINEINKKLELESDSSGDFVGDNY